MQRGGVPDTHPVAAGRPSCRIFVDFIIWIRRRQLRHDLRSDAFDLPERVRIDQSIPNESPFVAAVDHPCGVQEPEMPRDVLLRGVEFISQRLHRRLAAAIQVLDDAYPEWLCDHLEASGDLLDEPIRKRARQLPHGWPCHS